MHVGVSNDAHFEYYKKRKPIYPFEQRKAIIEAFDVVAKVHSYDIWERMPPKSTSEHDGMLKLLETLSPRAIR